MVERDQADVEDAPPSGHTPPGLVRATFHERLGTDPEGREEEQIPYGDDGVPQRVRQTGGVRGFSAGVHGAGEQVVGQIVGSGESRLRRHYAEVEERTIGNNAAVLGRVVSAPGRGRELEELARAHDRRACEHLGRATAEDAAADALAERHDALSPKHQAGRQSEGLGVLTALAIAAGLLLFPALQGALNIKDDYLAVAVVAGLAVEGIAVGTVWFLGKTLGELFAPSREVDSTSSDSAMEEVS